MTTWRLKTKMFSRHKFAISFVLLFGLLALVACTPTADTTAPTESTTETDQPTISFNLPMGYIPDPQYAPLYVAKEKGYFAAEGFDVDFDYSFETDGVALVGANEVPFALVSGDVVLSARAQEIPIVYVMEWWQKYPIALVSKQAANITAPEDIVGRNIGVPGLFGATYVGYSGLLAANEIDPESVQVSEIGFNQVEALLTDQVEGVMVYNNNEPLQLEALGEEINVIEVSDYIDMVANGLVTSEQFAAENPERVRGFVRAFVRGLEDTLADPDEAYEISQQYVEGLGDERRNVLDASIEMWQGERLGYSDPAAWEATQETLLGMGFLDAPLADLSAVYTNEFLPPTNQ